MDWNHYVLGLELGSTRIKAVLIDKDHTPVAAGSYSWENRFENGIWTYSIEEVQKGIRACYAALNQEVREKFGEPLTNVGAMGISGMMHGYLAFDRSGNQLVPFRTWRNTTTGPAAKELSRMFHFNIPQRWSIAHLRQAILNGEPHVKDIAYLTTLAGYVHWKLTGEKVLGVGEASGMFPIDSSRCNYHSEMLKQFDMLIPEMPWRLNDILPKVLPAGAAAGRLTEDGARFLDPTGTLKAGIPFCPPEGDAGTGMAATNSVSPGTGNVSAGTSIFSMIVLEQELSAVYPEIDMVTTPAGRPVAMIHCNNCTNEINAWAALFREFLKELGQEADNDRIYSAMFSSALKGEADCGGLVLYNYLSGEPVVGLDQGCPLLVRTPDARLSFSNFMRVQLYSALASLKIGMKLLEKEHVTIERLYGHGGFFKTPPAGQRLLSSAVGTPVSVMKTAGEGGPYGMALLAAFMLYRKEAQTLEDYLKNQVFGSVSVSTCMAEEADILGFQAFIDRYAQAMPLEHTAVKLLL